MFARVIEKVTTHALKLVMQNQERLQKLQEGEELSPCTDQFYSATGLPCAHTVQKRLKNGEPLRPEDFDLYWFFNKPIDNTHSLPDPINLAQNPRTVQAKGRPKGSYGKGKAQSSTERDSSHWEIVKAQITRDGSQLRDIYRQPKKRGRPTGAKPPSKATAVKQKTAAKKRKTMETLNLTDDDPIEASGGGVNEESDKRGQKKDQEEDIYEKFTHIDDFPPPSRKRPITYFSDTSSDEEASSKRPRRSSYARRAPKKSL
jgi:hypothetical protein